MHEDFPCPNCGVTTSPEDETEELYCILETKVRDKALEELLIQCSECANHIWLPVSLFSIWICIYELGRFLEVLHARITTEENL